MYFIYLVVRFGIVEIFWFLINTGCNVNFKIGLGEIVVMICIRYKYKECFKVFVLVGADFGLVNIVG